jgi:hypothetical protein
MTHHDSQPGIKSRYRLNRDVFLAAVDDAAHLLDFRRGRFYGLDIVAASMLAHVLESGAATATTRVARDFHTDEDRVRQDLEQLLKQLEEKRLIVCSHVQGRAAVQPGFPGQLLPKSNAAMPRASQLVAKHATRGLFRRLRAQSQPRKLPGRWRISLLLTAVWLSLRTLGWSRTVALLRVALLRRRSSNFQQPNETKAKMIVKAIDRQVRESACMKLLFPCACKERALAGYYLLRRYGCLPAALVLGIQTNPFLAHAWVECVGEVVTDDEAHCATFTPVARYC